MPPLLRVEIVSASSNGFAPIEAAVQFITAAGGIEQAKQALSTIERIPEDIG